jgi:hypothetical protein
VRFLGSVAELAEHALPRRYLVQVRNGRLMGERLEAMLQETLSGLAVVSSAGSEYYVLVLASGVVLGDALASLTAAEIQVLDCRDERPEIENAFVALVGDRE